jgi:hypothetical protein
MYIKIKKNSGNPRQNGFCCDKKKTPLHGNESGVFVCIKLVRILSYQFNAALNEACKIRASEHVLG